MKRIMTTLTILLLTFVSASSLECAENVFLRGEMILTRGDNQLTRKFDSYILDGEHTFVEFTFPAEFSGRKYYYVKDDIFYSDNSNPAFRKVEESAYDNAIADSDITIGDNYTAMDIEEHYTRRTVTENGKEKIVLNSRKTWRADYPMIEIFFTETDGVKLPSVLLLYDRNNRLTRKITLSDFISTGGGWIPAYRKIENTTLGNSYTEIYITEFREDHAASWRRMFSSLENLK